MLWMATYWSRLIFSPYEYRLYSNSYSSDEIGRYYESWDANNSAGWTLSGSSTSYSGGNLYVYYGNCCGAYSTSITSPVFNLGPNQSLTLVNYDAAVSWHASSNSSRYHRFEIKIDGASWQTIYSTQSTFGWTNFQFDLSEYSMDNTVQFRISTAAGYPSTYLDNFRIESNFFAAGASESQVVSALQDASTGGYYINNSTFKGELLCVNDSLSLQIESSVFRGSDLENLIHNNHGVFVCGTYFELDTWNSSISQHALDGIHIVSGLTDWTSTETSLVDNGADGISVSGDLDWTSTEDVIDGNGEDGVDAGANSNLTMYGPEIWNNGARGLAAAGGSVIDLDYARIDGNGSHGVDLENTGTLNMDNCRLLNNGGQGIQSGSPTTLNHCNLAFNGGTGLVLTGNNFHTLNNSILWGNNETNYTQIDIGGGVISTSYSTVQGQSGYGVTGSGQFYWGEGVIEADPLFADDDLHLNTYSPCVDGGQPWLMDAYMPYGLGGVRADMGMYGGPDNAYWGGLALPDGASSLLTVQDSPQDQGNSVGLTFSSSFYDNSELVNNVTHYAFWRHFDPTGAPITDVAEGNWELLGEMPSLSLNNYAYQAPTLGNTNAFGDFSSSTSSPPTRRTMTRTGFPT